MLLWCLQLIHCILLWKEQTLGIDGKKKVEKKGEGASVWENGGAFTFFLHMDWREKRVGFSCWKLPYEMFSLICFMAEPSTAIDSTVVAFVSFTLWSGMGPACPNQDVLLAQGTIKGPW